MLKTAPGYSVNADSRPAGKEFGEMAVNILSATGGTPFTRVFTKWRARV